MKPGGAAFEADEVALRILARTQEPIRVSGPEAEVGRRGTLAAVDRPWQGSYIERRFNIVPSMPDVLTLKQLADHLQLSERTIYRLLGRGQLPGFKVGGHWRFRRSVVDYWLDMRMARMGPTELLEMDQEWRSAALCLGDALTEENALLPLTGQSRQDIVGQLVRSVTFPEPVDTELVCSRIWAREQVASTATEDGVAFLHTARWDGRALCRHDLLAIGRLPAGVDFGALDGGRTDLILLLLARDARRHLFFLAKAARLCRQPGFLDGIRCADSGRDVVRLVRSTERELFTSTAPPAS